ncbi:Bet v I/Major latex protein domain-containing protein [Madurella fahalii]|uniref:Bet v I/Major latex protein domain-containing protein n=1 Tax=Madurella fahalii TaxID=1157608 RepID=A0ABQ0GGQ3_9PEZI
MLVINLGYTAPVNRPGQSPVLTLDQVWAGLQRKVRHAEEFVPLIEACEVVSEEKSETGEEVITRLVTFRQRPDAGPNAGKQVKEVCKLHAPCRVDFFQEDGSKIANYVTSGEGGELYMTYVFEWRHATVEAESEEARKLEETSKQTAKMAVESSIETIRRMVAKEG